MNEFYHYKECGLPNVYLANGYERVATPYGEGLVVHDLDQLYAAIGRHLCLQPVRLAGPELRFLRSVLNLSQGALGAMLGKTEQSVARWEKDHSPIDPAADRLVRLIYLDQHNGRRNVGALLKRLHTLTAARKHVGRVVAREVAKGWTAEAAAA